MFVKNTSSWVVNIDKRSLLASEENNVIWERQNIFFLWGLSDSNNIAIVYMQFINKDFSLKIYWWQQQPPEGCSSSFVRLTLQNFVKISRALTCFAASSFCLTPSIALKNITLGSYAAVAEFFTGHLQSPWFSLCSTKWLEESTKSCPSHHLHITAFCISATNPPFLFLSRKYLLTP